MGLLILGGAGGVVAAGLVAVDIALDFPKLRFFNLKFDIPHPSLMNNQFGRVWLGSRDDAACCVGGGSACCYRMSS